MPIIGHYSQAGTPQYPFELNGDSPQARGLQLWWPHIGQLSATAVANGVVTDLSGHGRHGDTRGAALTREISGLGISSLRTNGTSNYLRWVEPSGGALDKSSNYTLAMWVQAYDNDAMFFARYGVSPANTDHQIWGVNAALPEPIRFRGGQVIPSSTTLTYASGDVIFLAMALGSGASDGTGYFWNETSKSLETVTMDVDGTQSTTWLFGVDPDNGAEASLGNYANCRIISVMVWDHKLPDVVARSLFAPETRYDLYRETGRKTYFIPAAPAGANPKGPLGLPLHGPFGGPISV